MPNDYTLTPAAKNDVKEIWSYTVKRWSEQQAEKYMYQREKKFKDLVMTPILADHDLIFKKGIEVFWKERTLFSTEWLTIS